MRKIIQIVMHDHSVKGDNRPYPHILYGLCDDGSVWWLEADKDGQSQYYGSNKPQWQQLADIPQD